MKHDESSYCESGLKTFVTLYHIRVLFMCFHEFMKLFLYLCQKCVKKCYKNDFVYFIFNNELIYSFQLKLCTVWAFDFIQSIPFRAF